MAKQTESPQVTRDGIATKKYGGMAPTERDVIKSANARGAKRHEMKGRALADEGTLPASEGPVLDRAGIKNSGYLAKKGIPSGVNAHFNSLPPGMDIEDQENADIREMPFKKVVDLGYPGDGW